MRIGRIGSDVVYWYGRQCGHLWSTSRRLGGCFSYVHVVICVGFCVCDSDFISRLHQSCCFCVLAVRQQSVCCRFTAFIGRIGWISGVPQSNMDEFEFLIADAEATYPTSALGDITR